MKTIKKVWELTCIAAIPWMILLWGFIYSVSYQLHLNRTDKFDPNYKMIGFVSIFVSLLIMMQNLHHKYAGEEVGMLTWLQPIEIQGNGGSSKKRRAQNPKIPDELLSDKPEGFILGKCKNKFVRFFIKSGQIMHGLILGSVGTGKSTLLISSIISYLNKTDFEINKKEEIDKPDVAMFVVDIKPELFNVATNSKNPYVCAVNPEDRDSYGWDVYYAINDDTPEDQVVEQLDIISIALITVSKDNKNGAFFSETARNVFVGIMLFAHEFGMNFMESLEYLMSDSLDNILKEIMQKTQGKPNYRRVRSLLKPYVGKNDNEGLQNVEMTMRQNLKPFLSDNFRWLLGDNPKKTSPLDLEKRISIFLCLMDSKMDSYSVLMRLITMQLVKHGTQRNPNSHALMYVIDESPRLGGDVLRQITNFMALSRGFNVACILLAQSINQFYTELSAAETETLMEICRIIGVLSCKSKKQADILAGWAGTYLEKKTSYSHKAQKNVNNYNISYDEKPIFNASDLMHLMDKKEILLFVDGDFYKANAEQARYYKIPEFNRIAERNKKINGRTQKGE